MKIVYIITRSDVVGGASVHLIDLAHGMKQLGHEVLILVGGRGAFIDLAGEKQLECCSLKYLVRKISILRDFLAFFEIRKHLLAAKPDLVHLHSSKAGILGRLAAKTLVIPAVFTAHGWAFTAGVSPVKRFLYSRIERIISPFCDRIITVSEYDRQLALDYNVALPESVVTIHNGIHKNENSEKHDTSGVVKLIMVARFDVPKRQDLLVHALSGLNDLEWEMEFVGDGPNLGIIKKLAKSLGVENRIVFSGACDDVARRLADSDIFVLVSDWEGFPLTVLEAMRAGLPVIATDVGGIKEAIVDHASGYLIARNDILSLRKNIETLVTSKNLRSEMGREGRDMFLKNFTHETMLLKTVDIYCESLKYSM